MVCVNIIDNMNGFKLSMQNINNINVPDLLKPALFNVLNNLNELFCQNNLNSQVNSKKFMEKYLINNTNIEEEKLKIVFIDDDNINKENLIFENEMFKNASKQKEILKKFRFEKFAESYQFFESDYKYDKTKISNPQQISEDKDILIENCYGKSLFISGEFLKNKTAVFNEEEKLIILNNNNIKKTFINDFIIRLIFNNNYNEYLSYVLGHEFSHFFTLSGELEINDNNKLKTVMPNNLVFYKGKQEAYKGINYDFYMSKENHLKPLKELYAEFLVNSAFKKPYFSVYKDGANFLPLIEKIYNHNIILDVVKRTYSGFEKVMGKNDFKDIFSDIYNYTFFSPDFSESAKTQTTLKLLDIQKSKIEKVKENLSIKNFVVMQTDIITSLPKGNDYLINEKIKEINNIFALAHFKKENKSVDGLNSFHKFLSKAISLQTERLIESIFSVDNALILPFDDKKIVIARDKNKILLVNFNYIFDYNRYLGIKVVEDIDNFKISDIDNLKILFEKQKGIKLKNKKEFLEILPIYKNTYDPMTLQMKKEDLIINKDNKNQKHHFGTSRKSDTINALDLIAEHEIENL